MVTTKVFDDYSTPWKFAGGIGRLNGSCGVWIHVSRDDTLEVDRLRIRIGGLRDAHQTNLINTILQVGHGSYLHTTYKNWLYESYAHISVKIKTEGNVGTVFFLLMEQILRELDPVYPGVTICLALQADTLDIIPKEQVQAPSEDNE